MNGSISTWRWVILAVLVGIPALGGLRAQSSHAVRQTPRLTFHYGVVPSELVLAHSDQHLERSMHAAGARKGTSHVVLALFDAADGRRIESAEVHATVAVLGGSSQTKRLEPMLIAGQPSFGGYFTMGSPAIYRLRFEAKLAGGNVPAVAEFEHRVPGPERGR
jgi:hypothetical protein